MVWKLEVVLPLTGSAAKLVETFFFFFFYDIAPCVLSQADKMSLGIWNSFLDDSNAYCSRNVLLY